MAASRKQNVPTPPTPAEMLAESLRLVRAIGDAEKTGKVAVETATLESFTRQVDALVAAGQYAATTLAAILPTGQALTGENVAKLYAKDGALYPSSQDERDALKGANIWRRAIRAYQYDNADIRALFLNGPATLVPRCKALANVTGHKPGVVAYHEFLGVMNADAIAVTKALDAEFLSSFNIYRDETTGATLYAKRKPVGQMPAGTAAKVTVKRDDMPALVKVAELDRDALVALVQASQYDVNIAAADMVPMFEYIAARYRLSLMETPTDEQAAPLVKRSSF